MTNAPERVWTRVSAPAGAAPGMAPIKIVDVTTGMAHLFSG